MKKIYLLFVLLIGIQAWAQCDITPVNNASWDVIFTDSEWDANNAGEFAIDGDPLTIWHSAQNVPYPHEIQVDLGTSYPVSGIGMLPRQNNALNGKVMEHEIYLSNDGVSWVLQGGGTYTYVDVNDITLRQTTFGSIDARYVRFVGLNAYNDEYFTVIAELEVYQDLVCAPTGQNNQLIAFENILDKGTGSAPFDVTATASSGLPTTFEIVSGPASISGNTITLTGAPGVVEVKAIQEGDANYYPSESIQSFEVIDLSLYFPDVSSRFIDSYALEMPSLGAYPIYVNSSIEIPDELIEIEQVEIEVGGNTYTAEEEDGFYHYLWTPDSYGNHTLLIHAVATNGNVTTLTRDIEVVNTAVTQSVTSLQDVVIEFGGDNSRWYYGTYTLPQFLGAYNTINAFLEVECPNVNGGCDDWDRWAHIDIKAPDGNWIQLIRYITPYGVGCNHELDVTDYMSMLQGEIEFRVFIDTWGTGGWQLTLDFEYNQGSPEYLYGDVVEVWDGGYSFGDPENLQPVETFSGSIHEDVESSHLRVSNTGHGWGPNNTFNAAEFFNATHYIDIDGTETFIQNLWNVCNPNPDGCTGQQGSWTHSRAGWCPGAISPPNIYDLTPYVGTGINLDYRFHPTYQDNCHPNNPDCVSGSTCADCNDGFNPIYFVDTHIINRSNAPLVYGGTLGTNVVDDTLVYDVAVYPNPSTGVFSIASQYPDTVSRVTISGIDGKLVKAYYFDSSSELNSYSFDLSSISRGVYFINIENAYGTGVKRIILE